jgi:amino acid adenylation domain-containing protein
MAQADVTGLAGLLQASARRFPGNQAVTVSGGEGFTYAELDRLSDRLRDRLVHLGVRPGDRVGLRLHKSLDSVATIFGVLKAGAAYVPVDADSPSGRAAFILDDCQVKALITERAIASGLRQEFDARGRSPAIVALDGPGHHVRLGTVLDSLQASDPAPQVASVTTRSDDLAYILYTSGSTGKPKGVALSHANALSFIDWCSVTFEPYESDTFSSHAPFHFDLSILDIFVSLRHGARLVLFDEALGKDPFRLGEAIASEHITIWYSTPSALNLLAAYGNLDRYDYSALRIVCFAGEVFPIPQFQSLNAHWTSPRFYNLYGPTETNVCTYFEVPKDGSWAGMTTFPIGRMCEPHRGRVVDEFDVPVKRADPGELLVSGPNVMRGYWNQPDLNERAFLIDDVGERWYRTGDIVSEDHQGLYRFLGRRDRMVKRRGYRLELGEIEAALVQHPHITEAAVVAVADPQSGVKIAAFVALREAMTPMAVRRLAMQSLPSYMVPDAFHVLDALPRTSTNKVDLQSLRAKA